MREKGTVYILGGYWISVSRTPDGSAYQGSTNNSHVWHLINELPFRFTFAQAQEDLDALAQKQGWTALTPHQVNIGWTGG